MRGKGWAIRNFGVAALSLATACIGLGCVLPGSEQCICDLMANSKGIIVLDEQANPVDSATITVVRTADGKLLKRPEPGTGLEGQGKAVIFDDGITRKFPADKLEMQIRVTATKGGKIGEELFVVSTTECRCHFKVESGRDTVVIR